MLRNIKKPKNDGTTDACHDMRLGRTALDRHCREHARCNRRAVTQVSKPIEELKEGMPEGHTLFYFYTKQKQLRPRACILVHRKDNFH